MTEQENQMHVTEVTTEYATRTQRAAAYRWVGDHAPELAEAAYSTTVHGISAYDRVHITILIHAEDEWRLAPLFGHLIRTAAQNRALSDDRFRCYVPPRKTRIFDIRFYIERET